MRYLERILEKAARMKKINIVKHKSEIAEEKHYEKVYFYISSHVYDFFGCMF